MKGQSEVFVKSDIRLGYPLLSVLIDLICMKKDLCEVESEMIHQ